MNNCLDCEYHTKILIEGSDNGMKDVRCYYPISTFRDGKIPIDIWVGLFGEDIIPEIKPFKNCPVNNPNS